MSKKPMDLKNLPEYLRSVRDQDDAPAPVVNMGQIIVPQRKSYFPQIAIAASLLIASSGLFAYNATIPGQHTVTIEAEPQTITEIVSEIDADIISVKQNPDSTYDVKMENRSFFDWLFGRK
jgi:hypothetical protein